MTWVAKNLLTDGAAGTAGQKTLRSFADSLKSQSFDNAGTDVKETGLSSIVTKANNASADGKYSGTATVTPTKGAGVYLLLDESGDHQFGNDIWHASNAIIIGTPVTVSNSTNCPAIKTGSVNIKNEKTQVGGFSFTKTKADGTTGLADAKFAISKTVNGATKYGTYNESATGDKWTWTTENKPASTVTGLSNGVFTSSSETASLGTVSFPNLPAGTYKVEEIKAPDGYLQAVLPSFTVQITKFGANGAAEYKITKDDGWQLVTFTAGADSNATDSDVKVKNVTSITQLPLTGAAGTVLFTVVALLLAGAAVTVSLKSRSTKRALRA